VRTLVNVWTPKALNKSILSPPANELQLEMKTNFSNKCIQIQTT